MPPRNAAGPVFIIDECCGQCVVDGIIEAGGRATLLVPTCVPAGTPDVDWIPRIDEWGQALVTRDVAIRSNPAEAKALEICGVHVFIIRGHGMKLDELRKLMIDSYVAMARYVVKHTTPFQARITKSGIDVIVKSGRRGGIRRD